MFLSFDDTRLVLSAVVGDKILSAVPSRRELKKNHEKRFEDQDVRNDVTVLQQLIGKNQRLDVLVGCSNVTLTNKGHILSVE